MQTLKLREKECLDDKYLHLGGGDSHMGYKSKY